MIFARIFDTSSWMIVTGHSYRVEGLDGNVLGTMIETDGHVAMSWDCDSVSDEEGDEIDYFARQLEAGDVAADIQVFQGDA